MTRITPVQDLALRRQKSAKLNEISQIKSVAERTRAVNAEEVNIDRIGEIISAQMILAFRLMWTRMRTAAVSKSFLAFVGIIFNLIARELMFRYGTHPDCSSWGTIGVFADTDVVYDPPVMGYAVTILKCCVLASTLACICYLYRYYDTEHDFGGLSRAYLSDHPFWHTTVKRRFWMEVLLISIIEPPFFNIYLNSSLTPGRPLYMLNPWGFFMFIRCYMLIRLFSNVYYSGGTKVVGLWTRFDFRPAFVIRNILHDFPFLSVITLGTSMTLTTAYSVWNAERGPFWDQQSIHDLGENWTFFDAVWFTWVTMASVGYGELYPQTYVGRVIILMGSLQGIVLVAVVTATVIDQLTLFPYESRVVNFLRRAKSVRQTQILAAKVIQRMWRYRKACRTYNTKMVDILVTSGKRDGHDESSVRGCFGLKKVKKYHQQAIEGVFDFCEFRRQYKSGAQRRSNSEMVQGHVRDFEQYLRYHELFFSHSGEKEVMTEEERVEHKLRHLRRWKAVGDLVDQPNLKPRWYEGDYNVRNKKDINLTVNGLKRLRAQLKDKEERRTLLEVRPEEEEDDDIPPCVMRGPLGELAKEQHSKVTELHDEVEQIKETQKRMLDMLANISKSMGLKSTYQNPRGPGGARGPGRGGAGEPLSQNEDMDNDSGSYLAPLTIGVSKPSLPKRQLDPLPSTLPPAVPSGQLPPIPARGSSGHLGSGLLKRVASPTLQASPSVSQLPAQSTADTDRMSQELLSPIHNEAADSDRMSQELHSADLEKDRMSQELRSPIHDVGT